MTLRRRGRGTLNDEDRALWSLFAAGVVPLRPEERKALEPAAERTPPAPVEKAGAPPPPRKKPEEKPAKASPSPTAPAAKPKPPAPAPRIDRTTLRAIARGARMVQDRVDLHGMTQTEAHHRLVSFLKNAQTRDLRLVLVITGKGRAGDGLNVFAPHERGVLRRVVPHWLAQESLKPVVLEFSSATVSHGGDGAFYVRLRRRRGASVWKP